MEIFGAAAGRSESTRSYQVHHTMIHALISEYLTNTYYFNVQDSKSSQRFSRAKESTARSSEKEARASRLPPPEDYSRQDCSS